jgi:hypothetical protein
VVESVDKSVGKLADIQLAPGKLSAVHQSKAALPDTANRLADNLRSELRTWCKKQALVRVLKL